MIYKEFYYTDPRICQITDYSYYTLNNLLNYTNAELFCRDSCYSYLPIIASNATYKEFKYYCHSRYAQSVWIGCNNLSGNGYAWIDGSNFDFGGNVSGGIYPWYADEPDNNANIEACVAMSNSDLWHGIACNTEQLTVCQDCSAPYTLITSKLTWDNAKTYCNNHCGSDLVSIHGGNQNDFATHISNIHRDSTWIGLYWDINILEWQWSDNSISGINYLYPWYPSRPSDISLGEHCTEMWLDGQFLWSNNDCTNQQSFICGHCDGVLNKYVFVQLPMQYDNAQQYCTNTYNTDLASIHSQRDMDEAVLLCELRINPYSCWIGETISKQRVILFGMMVQRLISVQFGVNIRGKQVGQIMMALKTVDIYGMIIVIIGTISYVIWINILFVMLHQNYVLILMLTGLCKEL